MKLLEAYIKRIIAEQQSNNNDIIQAIIKKFPADYALARSALVAAGVGERRGGGRAFATGKRDAFWQKYSSNAAFKKLVNETYCYSKQTYFDFWLNSLELREFLREDLQSAELILVELDRVSALSSKQIERALSEARSVEEFRRLVLGEQASKANIWFELERKLFGETKLYL